MDPNPNHKRGRKLLRVLLFAFAVYLGILGCFVTLDSFIPKEKPVSTRTYIVQFLIGIMFLAIAVYIGRRNSLRWGSRDQAGKP
jgi:hypothetical protein